MVDGGGLRRFVRHIVAHRGKRLKVQKQVIISKRWTNPGGERGHRTAQVVFRPELLIACLFAEWVQAVAA
jgi:hypothetical protein